MESRNPGHGLGSDQPDLVVVFVLYPHQSDFHWLAPDFQWADFFPIERESIVERTLGRVADRRNSSKVTIHQFIQIAG